LTLVDERRKSVDCTNLGYQKHENEEKTSVTKVGVEEAPAEEVSKKLRPAFRTDKIAATFTFALSKERVDSDLLGNEMGQVMEMKDPEKHFKCRAYPCEYRDVSEWGLRKHWIVSGNFL
jgi:hypothetical protein